MPAGKAGDGGRLYQGGEGGEQRACGEGCVGFGCCLPVTFNAQHAFPVVGL